VILGETRRLGGIERCPACLRSIGAIWLIREQKKSIGDCVGEGTTLEDVVRVAVDQADARCVNLRASLATPPHDLQHESASRAPPHTRLLITSINARDWVD